MPRKPLCERIPDREASSAILATPLCPKICMVSVCQHEMLRNRSLMAEIAVLADAPKGNPTVGDPTEGVDSVRPHHAATHSK